MRTRLRNKGYGIIGQMLIRISLVALIVVSAGNIATGGIKKMFKGGENKAEEKAPTGDIDIYDLSLEDNLYTPEITKNNSVVSEFQLKEARELKKKGYNVELMRDGEVIIVTLLAGQLFAPNDTTLNDVGKLSLRPLLKYLATPDMYKMILVMHTDNTGSETYTKELSKARVDAIFSWIEDNASADYVVPYAVGADEPLYTNNSVENRRLNRRLEIYLVPGNIMAKQAMTGKLNFNR